MTDSLIEMITDGKPTGTIRRGYYIGASCEHVVPGSSDVGPLLVQWLMHYMAPKGHSLMADGFPGSIPTEYTDMIQARLDEKNGRGDTGWKIDWAVIGFSGECIVDAMAGPPYPTLAQQVTNIGLLDQLAENVFYSKICPSTGRSVPYLYNAFSVTQEEFDVKWAAYAAAYEAALDATVATGIQIWSQWEPSGSTATPFFELGDYHPTSESARLAAVALLAEVEQVYT